jgi:hypothetical protein
MQHVGSLHLGGSGGGSKVFPPSFRKPQKKLLFRRPPNFASTPTGGEGDCPVNTSFDSVASSSLGVNATVRSIFDDSNEEEEVQASTRSDGDVVDPKPDPDGRSFCFNAMAVGCLVAFAHFLFCALYQSRSPKETAYQLWSAFAGIFLVLMEDPEDIIFPLEGQVVGGGGGGFLHWVHSFCNLLWVFSSVILLLVLFIGKKRIVYPWLLMMVFSHMTTASTLFEIWGYFAVSPPSSAAFWSPFLVCAATLVFGTAAIYLAWRDLRMW